MHRLSPENLTNKQRQQQLHGTAVRRLIRVILNCASIGVALNAAEHYSAIIDKMLCRILRQNTTSYVHWHTKERKL